MASRILETWAQSTVMIETPFGSRGTAFIVGRDLGDGVWNVALITNKHVLHADAATRSSIRSITVHINRHNGDEVEKGTVLLNLHPGAVVEHPDPAVDVLAIPCAVIFGNVPNIAHRVAPESLFATAEVRKRMDITAGEDVLVVGYPSGIRQGRTNHPLIRQGLIASRIGEELHEEAGVVDGQMTYRVSRGFLFDGATIPGTSGSPVVLKPTAGRRIGNDIHMGEVMPVLLGIVAETRFAPVGGVGIGFAGLGLAFDVETIVEVLDLLPDR